MSCASTGGPPRCGALRGYLLHLAQACGVAAARLRDSGVQRCPYRHRRAGLKAAPCRSPPRSIPDTARQYADLGADRLVLYRCTDIADAMSRWVRHQVHRTGLHPGAGTGSRSLATSHGVAAARIPVGVGEVIVLPSAWH
jgi:hypothetical protein